jgi:DNA-binding transcriptional LysR family regulator
LPVVSLVTGPFARKHPLVRIAVLSMTSNEVMQGLADFELDAGITYLDAEPIGHVRSLRLYSEDYVLLTSEPDRFAGRTSVTWREAAELPLCLLTPNMQNRRIIDGVFRSVGRVPLAAVETNSIVNLCAHVRTGPWSSVMPRAILHLFGVPAGTRALRMVEPEAHKTMGLVASDRDPASPVTATLFEMAGALAIDEVLAAVSLA